MKKIALIIACGLASTQILAATMTCPTTSVSYTPGQSSYLAWQVTGNPGNVPNTFKFIGANSTFASPYQGQCVYTLDGQAPANQGQPVLMLTHFNLKGYGSHWDSSGAYSVCKSSSLDDCKFAVIPG